MPAKTLHNDGLTKDLYDQQDASVIQSSSTLGGSELEYIPEIVLSGSSNEALKGESALLDGADEESFTLDTFDRLIRSAHKAGKAFLLARVTTADPVDSHILYHSYYAAHHINKVLFRTQPEQGLLHRMKSKNPLNNMVIIGDVDYYMVDPRSVDRALKRLHIETKKEDFTRSDSLIKRHQRTVSDLSGVKAGLKDSKRGSTTGLLRATSSYQSSILEAAEAVGPRRRIQYEATFFATDDDYLMKTEIREMFKLNSVNPDDYMLFTLFSNGREAAFGPNGELIAGFMNDAQVPRPDPTWRNLWGCLNGWGTASLSNGYTGFLTNRGLAVFFVLYLVLSAVLLRFLIPFEYVYLVAFGLAFVFVAVIVLFVEAGPR